VPNRVVIWDFDGTLAYRSGLWSDCLVDILDEELPGHGHGREVFRPAMQRGFRWHDWESEHPRIENPDDWWLPVTAIAAGAFRDAGYPPDEADRLAARLRETYLRRTHWARFEDSLAALELLRADGWRTVILSNHVPELPELIAHLGFDRFIDAVFNSAVTGFEKPHPRAYRDTLEALGRPRPVWMVGDQPRADVEGAEAAGIPAILVRTDAPSRRRAATALEAARHIVERAALRP
jgi:putative hydrolase of the HAD superfamily